MIPINVMERAIHVQLVTTTIAVKEKKSNLENVFPVMKLDTRNPTIQSTQKLEIVNIRVRTVKRFMKGKLLYKQLIIFIFDIKKIC